MIDKISLFLCISWLSSLTLNAQIKPLDKSAPDQLKRKRIELIAGASLLYPLGGNWPKEEDARRITYGYSLGVGYSQFSQKRFELVTRLLWERKGYATNYTNRYTDSLGNSNLSEAFGKQKLDYFIFSQLLKIHFGQEFSLITGAYLGLLMHNEFYQEIYLNNQYSFSYFASNVDDRFKSVDFGLSLGSSYKMEVTRKLDMELQLLSNFGLSNIVSNKFPALNIKQSSLIVSLILILKH